MQLSRTIAAVCLAAGIACSGAAGAAKLDPDHYLITKETMARMQAIEAEFDKAGYKPLDKDEDQDERDRKKGGKNDNPSPEELVREIESNREAMAALKRHGLTSRDFALTSFALLHAGIYVMFEDTMEKKGAADMLARFTKEQRANVALVRAMNPKKPK